MFNRNKSKLSAIKKGVKNQNISIALKGRKRSEESIKKQSISSAISWNKRKVVQQLNKQLTINKWINYTVDNN